MHPFHRLAATALAGGCVAAVALGTTGAGAASSTLKSSMNGPNETAPGDANGKGSATFTLDAAKGKVCYRFKLTRTEGAIAAHIHRGPAGKDGPVVVEFKAKPASGPSGCTTGVKASLIRSILKSPKSFYANVHTPKFQGGSVRGQLSK